MAGVIGGIGRADGDIMGKVLLFQFDGKLPNRKFGVDPYPIPFDRNPESVGFQRWVCGAYDRYVVPTTGISREMCGLRPTTGPRP